MRGPMRNLSTFHSICSYEMQTFLLFHWRLFVFIRPTVILLFMVALHPNADMEEEKSG